MRIRTTRTIDTNNAGDPEVINADFGLFLTARWLRMTFTEYADEGSYYPQVRFEPAINSFALPIAYASNSDDTGATFTYTGDGLNAVQDDVNEVHFTVDGGTGSPPCLCWAYDVADPNGTYSFDVTLEYSEDDGASWLPIPDDTPVTIRGFDRYYSLENVSADLVADGLVEIVGVDPGACFWTDMVEVTEDCGV